MERTSIAEKLRKFIVNGNAEQPLGNDENLFDSGMFDSVRIINLVLFVEETFSLELDFDDLTEENLSTLDAITDLVESKLAA